MRKHRNKIIAGAVCTVILALAFWWGGSSDELHGWRINSNSEASATFEPVKITDVTDAYEPVASPIASTAPQKTDMPEEKAVKTNATMSVEEKLEAAEKISDGKSLSVGEGNAEYSESQGMELDGETGTDEYMTEPVPENKPVPKEPQDAVITDTELTCTLSVRCDTVLKKLNTLDSGKAELIPADGVIFPEQTVTFYEGESVFDLLQREMKKNKIHFEFKKTPLYNSAYIMGINNLYEFDCGELSGWMYKVNGWFPNYGCARYTINKGDKIEVVYTCDLGVDVGGFYSAEGNG